MNKRIGEVKLNSQGCEMICIKYNNCDDIVIQFLDEFGYIKNTTWSNFKKGNIKNPYYPSIYNVGIVGVKYPISNNRVHTKEYETWNSMLERCYSNLYKNKFPTYKDATCCKEWLYYENFYEWLHSQENFEKWFNNGKWHLDKDILIKGNMIYSPNTCCLIPHNVNELFTKNNKIRGNLPIGVSLNSKKTKFAIRCNDGYGNCVQLGEVLDSVEGFNIYKNFKENVIKKIAQEEYSKWNITKRCYDAMMNYIVEITD